MLQYPVLEAIMGYRDDGSRWIDDILKDIWDPLDYNNPVMLASYKQMEANIERIKQAWYDILDYLREEGSK